ncbi:MAG: hypothetical protein PF488_04200 [Patescibacteria group bacterium]|jgi:hypothetical protein|nr:hypothetical protein [Patescibacteria group bacterium]
MTWINFLHFYQPANIEEYVIQEALDKSYFRIIRLLEENPKFKLTINISGCLLERLDEMGEKDFIIRMRKLVEEKRLELVGTAAYHALLPLMPEDEVKRQIKTNEEILKKFFGSDFKPSGFFFPEMAYSVATARVVKEMGYNWAMLDEFSAFGVKEFDRKKPYKDRLSGLKIIFRDRNQSRAYPPDLIIEHLKEERFREEMIITGTDGELYGLRHEDPTGEMEKIARLSDKVKTKNISSYLNKFKEEEIKEVDLRPSSWESSEKDLESGQPFILWSNKKNKIHRDLWRLANLAISVNDEYKEDENYYWYRWHLVRGLASCTFWWASANDFSANFGPYAWNPDIVDRGLNDLIRSIRSLTLNKSKHIKLTAEKYYLKINKNLWREHWEKHWFGK